MSTIRSTSHAPGKGAKLLDQYSQALRNRHYSSRTEKAWVSIPCQQVIAWKRG